MEWLKKTKEYIDTKLISFRHGGWQDYRDEYIYSFDFDLIKERKEKIYVSGHTHIQTVLYENNRIYVNPGSVGQPRDYLPTAAFALIDDDNDYKVILRRTQYDIECIINKMHSKGFPSKIAECLIKGTKIGEIR